jgi:hypothetical protein
VREKRASASCTLRGKAREDGTVGPKYASIPVAMKSKVAREKSWAELILLAMMLA